MKISFSLLLLWLYLMTDRCPTHFLPAGVAVEPAHRYTNEIWLNPTVSRLLPYSVLFPLIIHYTKILIHINTLKYEILHDYSELSQQ